MTYKDIDQFDDLLTYLSTQVYYIKIKNNPNGSWAIVI